jgi:hypothetical protein
MEEQQHTHSTPVHTNLPDREQLLLLPHAVVHGVTHLL